MAHNDFMPVTENPPKRSKKKEIIWVTVITIFLVLGALVLILNCRYRYVEKPTNYIPEYTKVSTIIMLITIGITFFLTLGMLLLKSIEWKDPEKCERILHYFYLAILVLSIAGIASGITGLTA